MAISDLFNKESLVGGGIFAITSGIIGYLFSEWKKNREEAKADQREDVGRVKAAELEAIKWTDQAFAAQKDTINGNRARITELEKRFDEWQDRQQKREEWYRQQMHEAAERIAELTDQLEQRDREIHILREELHALKKQVNGKH